MRVSQFHPRLFFFVSTLFTILLQLPVAARDLPGEKQVYSYSVDQLQWIGKTYLNEDIDTNYVSSNLRGDALYVVARDGSSTKVAVVPLDPNQEVRVVTLPGLYTGQDLKCNETVEYFKSNKPKDSTVDATPDPKIPPGNPQPVVTDAGDLSFISGVRQYVFHESGNSPLPLKYMVYRKADNGYLPEPELEIQSPSGQHGGGMSVDDFDPISGYVLLCDYYDFPFSVRDRGLVFDLNKKEIVWKKWPYHGEHFLLRGDVLVRFKTPKSQ